MAQTNGQNRRTFSNLLVNTLSHLNSGSDTDLSLEEFLSGIRELFGLTGILWWEIDRSGKFLSLASYVGPFDPDPADMDIPAKDEFLKVVIEGSTPQVLEGPALRESLPESIISNKEVETALGVRVGSKDRPFGILIALFPSGASLALQQMETAQLLATELGRTLRAQSLHEEVQTQFNRLKLLQGLSRILQSDEPIDERLHDLIESLTSAFDANYGHVVLADEDAGVLRFRASSGIDIEELTGMAVEPGTGIIGKVFQNGQPLLSRDVTEDPDYVEGYPNVRSELAVPIEAEGEIMGVLNLESDRPGAFDPDDLRMAGIIASQTGAILRHALAYDAAMSHLKELELLNRVTRAISVIDDIDELLQTIVQEIHGSLDVTSVGILLVGQDGVEMNVRAAAGDYSAELSKLKLRVGKGVTGDAALKGTTQYIPDVTRDDRYVPIDPNIRCELAVPLISKGTVIGVLNLESTSTNAYGAEDRHVVEIVAAQIAQILTKALLYEELATMAVTDGLTGLFNHRHFFVRLDAEFKRAIRYSYPLSLIMCDIDFFKNFNDTHGHLRGDAVLREIAVIITRTMRETDVVSRYGGEEFAAILPLCHESTALEVAERLRQSIESAGLGGDEESKPLTISIGICSAPKYASSYEEIVKRADDALYRSKQMGRNRCTLWRPELAETSTA